MEDTGILVPRLILDSRAGILLPPNIDEMDSERSEEHTSELQSQR